MRFKMKMHYMYSMIANMRSAIPNEHPGTWRNTSVTWWVTPWPGYMKLNRSNCNETIFINFRANETCHAQAVKSRSATLTAAPILSPPATKRATTKARPLLLLIPLQTRDTAGNTRRDRRGMFWLIRDWNDWVSWLTTRLQGHSWVAFGTVRFIASRIIEVVRH